MADDEHVEILKQGTDAWNTWRKRNPSTNPDLSNISLARAELDGADFHNANLMGADLRRAQLKAANFRNADLERSDLTIAQCSKADFWNARLYKAVLVHANLRLAELGQCNLQHADLTEAHLSKASLLGADLTDAKLIESSVDNACLAGAKLCRADLTAANLYGTDLMDADLAGAQLIHTKLPLARLLRTNLRGATLSDCWVHGASVWRVQVDAHTVQTKIIITDLLEPQITVDDLEVAQFIYMILNNDRLRSVINTVTSKVVLILGRFREDRKAVLDALREELRRRGYVPVMFDFERPNQTTDETISTLAGMARFAIADLTDAKCILQELRNIVPNRPSLPVQPILLSVQREPGMFDFFENSRGCYPPSST